MISGVAGEVLTVSISPTLTTITITIACKSKVSGFATGRVMLSCAGGSWGLFVPKAFPAEAAFPLWGVPGGFSQYQLTSLPLEQHVALARR